MDALEFRPFVIRKTVAIQKLYSLRDFHFEPGYRFEGATRGFWEMMYVDQGAIEVRAGDCVFRLRQGEVIFHRPNESYSFTTGMVGGTDLLVISFSTVSKAMNTFGGGIYTLDSCCRQTLLKLRREAQASFGPVLDICELRELKANEDAPVGSQQLIAIYLEQLLIILLRNAGDSRKETNVILSPNITDDQNWQEVISLLIQFMRRNLGNNLRFSEFCRELGVGSTALKTYFKRNTGVSVMDYYQRLRIDEARRMLRSGKMNVTQIAEHLGYTSVQVFSRQFKHYMGIPPLQYLKMVKQ